MLQTLTILHVNLSELRTVLQLWRKVEKHNTNGAVVECFHSAIAPLCNEIAARLRLVPDLASQEIRQAFELTEDGTDIALLYDATARLLTKL